MRRVIRRNQLSLALRLDRKIDQAVDKGVVHDRVNNAGLPHRGLDVILVRRQEVRRAALTVDVRGKILVAALVHVVVRRDDAQDVAKSWVSRRSVGIQSGSPAWCVIGHGLDI